MFNIEALSRWEENFEVGDALDRLGAALFVRGVEPKVRLMAMFSAYFDASGHHKQPFVVVAGYIANFSQWKALEVTWKHIHEKHRVNLPFHAAEFEAAVSTETYKNQKNARRDYVEVAKEPERAKEFFNNLCVAQISMVHSGISCIVPMAIYEQVASPDLWEKIPPYALGARVCTTWIRQWQKDFDVQQSVETIFEFGDFGQGEFTKLMVSEGAEPPIYKRKNDFAGLQAADHYAWEQFYRLKQEAKDNSFPFRESFQLLLDAIPKRHLQPDAEGLRNLCIGLGIEVKK